jgi:hypothetical protein
LKARQVDKINGTSNSICDQEYGVEGAEDLDGDLKPQIDNNSKDFEIAQDISPHPSKFPIIKVPLKDADGDVAENETETETDLVSGVDAESYYSKELQEKVRQWQKSGTISSTKSKSPSAYLISPYMDINLGLSSKANVSGRRSSSSSQQLFLEMFTLNPNARQRDLLDSYFTIHSLPGNMPAELLYTSEIIYGSMV